MKGKLEDQPGLEGIKWEVNIKSLKEKMGKSCLSQVLVNCTSHTAIY